MKKIYDAGAFLKHTGLIFEINRKILHPLGLALETRVGEDGGVELGDIVDGRDDPEGIIYSAYCYALGEAKFKIYMKEQGNKILKSRIEKLGYLVQKPKKEIS